MNTIPSIDEVMLMRSRTRRLLRLSVLGLATIAVIWLSWEVIQRGLRTGSGYPFLSYSSDEVTFTAAVAVVCAAALLLEGRLIRWLVPLPKPECPQCGYAVRNLASNRCPECGLEFSGEAAAT